jgi:hypothetical protein
VQTQQEYIETLETRIVELEQCDCKIKNGGHKTAMSSDSLTTLAVPATFAELGQNNPNPFKENTTITYSIPENTKSAMIIVYDLQGKELESYMLETTGRGAILIDGNTFKAGMYVYALIVDGVYIDSKKMVLTK